MIRCKMYIIAVMLFSLSEVIASTAPHFEENAPPSLADYLHMSRSKDPIDGGWLPNLTGLPSPTQVALLTQRAANVALQEKDKRCTSINLPLRMLIFQHFLIYQHMANAQNIYFDEQTAQYWAHVLAMILKESDGDSTSVTDMKGHSLSRPPTSLVNWKKILNLPEQNRVHFDYQTNFGLTQTSADRLFAAFHLVQDQAYDTDFLEGKEGAETPRKINLNTAIAIRRLIWFYQDFAQGRVFQSDGRIYQNDINNPELVTKYQTGLEMALMYCGTRFMFNKNYYQNGQKMPALKNAMASIAYCKLGNSHSGYGVNEVDEECFAQWVTLCPALNIDIALLTPLSYFATRGEKPVCEDTFKLLINKKPEALTGAP